MVAQWLPLVLAKVYRSVLSDWSMVQILVSKFTKLELYAKALCTLSANPHIQLILLTCEWCEWALICSSQSQLSVTVIHVLGDILTIIVSLIRDYGWLKGVHSREFARLTTWGVLREDRRGPEPPKSTVKHQLLFRFDRLRVARVSPHQDVHHWHLCTEWKMRPEKSQYQ